MKTHLYKQTRKRNLHSIRSVVLGNHLLIYLLTDENEQKFWAMRAAPLSTPSYISVANRPDLLLDILRRRRSPLISAGGASLISPDWCRRRRRLRQRTIDKTASPLPRPPVEIVYIFSRSRSQVLGPSSCLYFILPGRGREARLKTRPLIINACCSLRWLWMGMQRKPTWTR